jgi:predicted transcriptional regulator
MPKTDGLRQPFQGFGSPNYTQVPDEVFDVLAPDLTEAELRVLLYIVRRTFGFKKSSDDISLKQLVEGIRTQDGRVLDRGASVSKSTAVRAVKGLIEQGIITATRNRSSEKGDEPTTYHLRFKADPVFYSETRGGSAIEHPRVLPQNPQQTDRQQTGLNHSKFERSNDDLEQTDGIPKTAESPAAVTAPKQGSRPPGSVAERERLASFLTDFGRELGDEAPLSSTVTRVLNIFTAAGIPPEQWADHLYQARGKTQEATAQIRRQAVGNGPGLRRKNKMPYFLATLEQLVGLRPPPSAPPARTDRAG